MKMRACYHYTTVVELFVLTPGGIEPPLPSRWLAWTRTKDIRFNRAALYQLSY